MHVKFAVLVHARLAVRQADCMHGDSSALITVSELAGALRSSEPLAVLDVRWTPDLPSGYIPYLAGHVPTARYVDLDAELCGPAGEHGRRPIPKASAFTASMRAAGVSANRPVVVYDGADSTAAARAWWLLRYFGHHDVRVLDGGFAAWRAAGHAEETGNPPLVSEGDFEARSGGMPTVDATAVTDVGIALDARTSERHRAGHIPGTVNVSSLDNVGPDGRFLTAHELRDRFMRAGVDEGCDRVAVYCGSGLIATHEILALSLVGVTAALYPGSWSHWTIDADRPVAKS